VRPFDPELLDILKTETEYEHRLRTSEEERRKFIQAAMEGSGKLQQYEELTEPVSVARKIRFVDWPPHRDRLLEMNYVISGTMTVHVGEETICLKPGDFFLPNQYTMYAQDALGEDDIVVSFVMQPQFHEEVCVRLKVKTVLSEFMIDTLRRDISWNRYLHFTHMTDVAVQNLAETLVFAAFPYLDDQNMRRGSSPDGEITALMAEALFVALSRNLSALAEASPTNFDEAIRQTTANYIGNNYRTASLQELAQMVNQSESSLSRQIKSVFGYTFKELLLQKRFERAVELLQQTNLSVSDVACAVGYENTSFFYRRFREIYGISPKDYRKQGDLPSPLE
jgi:AraC-like DNA-binding protein/mannose-6-phosphate isomerase-like protein (cupin superfamily)